MTEEVEALLEKADRSIGAARLLLEKGFPDHSASRSYYAVYYGATLLLARHGYAFKRHSAMLSAFSKLLHDSTLRTPKN